MNNLPKYKSLGAKIVAHEEHLANKRIPVDPIMESDVRDGVLNLEALLRVAKCPDQNCVDGATSSINDASEVVAEQCQWCAEKERLLEKYQGFLPDQPSQTDYEWDVEELRRKAE